MAEQNSNPARHKAGQRQAKQGEKNATGVYYIPTTQRVSDAEGGREKAASTEERSSRSKVPALLALALILVLGGVAWHLWSNRKVPVTINGSSYQVRIDSTLKDAARDLSLKVRHGNLVSVKGDVLKRGGGYAFTATVNGKSLPGRQGENYRVSQGDTIKLAKGKNIMEPHTTSTTSVAPKLVMKGGFGPVAYVRNYGKAGSAKVLKGKRSKQTAEVVTKKATDTEIYLRTPVPEGGKQLVALTFDDGPSDKYTQQYLDILNKYHAKATFFCLGKNVQQYPELAKAIVKQGSQIANHTQDHKQLTTLDAAEVQSELSSGFKAISSATGVETTVFRPPYGDFRETTWVKSAGIASASITWTQDSKDWKLPGVDQIVSNALLNVKSGDIILMHDGGGNRDQDVQALPKIIEALQKNGYTLVTIDELMASDSTIPSSIQSGNAKMPEGTVWPTELGDA